MNNPDSASANALGYIYLADATAVAGTPSTTSRPPYEALFSTKRTKFRHPPLKLQPPIAWKARLLGPLRRWGQPVLRSMDLRQRCFDLKTACSSILYASVCNLMAATAPARRSPPTAHRS